MHLQPPFPPFFLRGLGRRRSGTWRPEPLRTWRRFRNPRVCGGGTVLPKGPDPGWRRFRRGARGGFVSGGFRGVSGPLLRALSVRRGRAGGCFSGRFDGRSRCGARAPSAAGARRAEECPASACAGFCAGCGSFAALRGAFCSVLRAGRCCSAPAFRPDRWRIWLRHSGPVSAPGCVRDAGAFCAGFRAGTALRTAYSGTGPSVGIVSPVSFWMSQRYSNSSSEQNDHAAPSYPARPVRPMRWT